MAQLNLRNAIAAGLTNTQIDNNFTSLQRDDTLTVSNAVAWAPSTAYTLGQILYTLESVYPGGVQESMGFLKTGVSYTTTVAARSNLSTVTISGTAGQFTCATETLSVGMAVNITGTNTGTGSITGYDPTAINVYYIIGTPTSTTFTLSATPGGTAITTTAGTPAGLTFTRSGAFTAAGAPNNFIGTVFTATGAGVGSTGTATRVTRFYQVTTAGTTSTTAPNWLAPTSSTSGTATLLAIDLPPAYLPLDVLDKIKLVDGAGSALDADLLDGQQGSYYLDTSATAQTKTGDLTIAGNLTVNGTTTTINSSTITVDDKNIELGSVSGVAGLIATLATGTAVVTLTTGTTRGLIPGQALTKSAGTGVFGTTPVIATIDSLTQFTASVNHATAGSITFDAGGVTDTTANGGGITLRGATDKTFQWLSTTAAWTSSEDINLVTGKVYEINGTTVLSSTALGSGVTGSSLTSVGTIGTGIWQGTSVAAAYGGTGQTSYAIGDLLYATSSTALGKLADVATGNALLSGGVATAPSWGKVGLTTHVSGTLPIANGGTNSTTTPTNGGVAYGTGTALGYSLVGTAGQFLKSAAAAAPVWATLQMTDIPDAAFKKSVTVATTTDLAASSWTTAASGTLSGYSASASLAVTTTLSSTTATTTSTSGIKVGATISGNANIPGGATVTAITNATTFTLSVAATAAASAVTTTFTNTIAALSIDGVSVAVNDRVLVKDQSTLGGIADATAAAKHGIYTVSAIGSASVPWVLVRAVDADVSSEISSAIVAVDNGTVNGSDLWTNTFRVSDTLNTTAMNWYEILYNSGSWAISTTGSAATLTTSRTLWGQSFNGSANVTGALSSVTTIGMSGQLTNTQATGSAPFVITSTTRVANLNVATAGTADTLTTARTINGTSFNGSANITTTNWGTSRNLTIGGTAKAVDGSAAVSWSLAEIGALALTGGTIATTNSSASLTISDTGTSGANIRLTGNGATTPSKTIRASSGELQVVNNAYSTVILSLTDAGNLTAVGNVTAYSDARLKTDLEVITGALDKVEQLTGYVYTRTDSGERQTGILAQDALKVLPEVVNTNGEYYSVAYGNMAGLIFEAIKELHAKVKDLETKIK
jgi:hypothetical protein